MGSLREQEVACSTSDRQGSIFESCVCRAVSSHHPQEILLAKFSLHVHKGGIKPHSFHFACLESRGSRVRSPLWRSDIKETNVSSPLTRQESVNRGEPPRGRPESWRALALRSLYNPQEVILDQFSLYVHKGGLKPHSFSQSHVLCSLQCQ